MKTRLTTKQKQDKLGLAHSGKNGEIFGFSSCAVMRALAKAGATKQQVTVIMKSKGIAVSPVTISVQCDSGAGGFYRGEPAPLDKSQIADLMKLAPENLELKKDTALPRKTRHKRRKSLRKRNPELVTQYLENLSSEGLEEHADIIRKFVSQRIGIYALYHRGKLYYAGLASDLQWRLKQHLRDKHKGKWDTFSVYLTIGEKHLRELESLVLRIMQPPGNKQLGRFAGAQDLYRELYKQIAEKHRAERARLFGREISKTEKTDKLNRATTIRARYKGKLVWARMRKDGRLRCNGKLYSSPSAAATAIRKNPTNGWDFWEYQRSPGYWVTIDFLRNE